MHLCSLRSLYSPCTYDIIVVINLCFSLSAGISGLVLRCLLSPLSCPLNPQLVEADGRPSWFWFWWRFLPVKMSFFLFTVAHGYRSWRRHQKNSEHMDDRDLDSVHLNTPLYHWMWWLSGKLFLANALCNFKIQVDTFKMQCMCLGR